MKEWMFVISLSSMLVHEMDAIRCKEWRIFPGLSQLNDKVGERVFILAHIPLISWILYSLFHDSTEGSFRQGFCVFAMIHLVLHVLFLFHPRNQFKDIISWLPILLSALTAPLSL